jgi:cytochrome c
MKIICFLFTLPISLNCSFLYAGADAKNGEQLYATHCTACHSIEVSLAGPAHRGVFGRKAGSVADFDYSPALRNSKVIWNEQTLEQWLANPEKFIQGQRMGYSVSNAQERKDLIEFLKKQSKP